jgi:uncharacterized protein (DUF4415 family)
MKKKRTSKPSDENSKRLADMTEDDIDTTDIPDISPEQFAQAVVRDGLVERQPKAQLTLRLDRDVLEWFRRQGRGYQTRINSLLRAYMVANRKGTANKNMHGSDLPPDSQAPNGP